MRVKGYCLECVRRALARSGMTEDLWNAFEEVIPDISDIHGTVWGECIGSFSDSLHYQANRELIVRCGEKKP